MNKLNKDILWKFFKEVLLQNSHLFKCTLKRILTHICSSNYIKNISWEPQNNCPHDNIYNLRNVCKKWKSVIDKNSSRFICETHKSNNYYKLKFYYSIT